MTETISFIKESLSAHFPEEEIRGLTRIILEHTTGMESYQLLLCKDKDLSSNEKEQVSEILSRLKKNEPIQYIIGKTFFYNSWFRVNPAVLIPRPETEELVDLIIQQQNHTGPHILDIGTGSGCIAVSLAKNIQNAVVSAIDISIDALNIAKENALDNNTIIRFYNESILDVTIYEKITDTFDVIVSNPPYITEMEKAGIDRNVLDHEPHLALFVKDDDPLLFYRHIAAFGQKRLKTGGKLYFEINTQFGEEMKCLLNEMGYSPIEIIKDTFNKDRIISAVK